MWWLWSKRAATVTLIIQPQTLWLACWSNTDQQLLLLFHEESFEYPILIDGILFGLACVHTVLLNFLNQLSVRPQSIIIAFDHDSIGREQRMQINLISFNIGLSICDVKICNEIIKNGIKAREAIMYEDNTLKKCYAPHHEAIMTSYYLCKSSKEAL